MSATINYKRCLASFIVDVIKTHKTNITVGRPTLSHSNSFSINNYIFLFKKFYDEPGYEYLFIIGSVKNQPPDQQSLFQKTMIKNIDLWQTNESFTTFSCMAKQFLETTF